jgi:hypothetical protein
MRVPGAARPVRPTGTCSVHVAGETVVQPALGRWVRGSDRRRIRRLARCGLLVDLQEAPVDCTVVAVAGPARSRPARGGRRCRPPRYRPRGRGCLMTAHRVGQHPGRPPRALRGDLGAASALRRLNGRAQSTAACSLARRNRAVPRAAHPRATDTSRQPLTAPTRHGSVRRNTSRPAPVGCGACGTEVRARSGNAGPGVLTRQVVHAAIRLIGGRPPRAESLRTVL